MALSSEITTKALPKEEGKDHIVHFRGEIIINRCVHVCVVCSIHISVLGRVSNATIDKVCMSP